jgi:hypothetical protein
MAWQVGPGSRDVLHGPVEGFQGVFGVHHHLFVKIYVVGGFILGQIFMYFCST